MFADFDNLFVIIIKPLINLKFPMPLIIEVIVIYQKKGVFFQWGVFFNDLIQKINDVVRIVFALERELIG